MRFFPVVLAWLVWLAALAPPALAAALVPDVGGTIRHFDLTLTWETHAPDGFARKMALVNGQFPGPLIEVNEGDVVVMRVHNKMPYNTTIHCHGIEMRDSNWSDGVPGLTQRQIKTGHSFVYRWKATQYGSYWYHAHQRGQIDDGLYGPIMIRPKATTERPFHLIANSSAMLAAMLQAERTSRAVVLSDFRHVTSYEGWDIEVAAGIETPCYDAILFNGQGRVSCWPAAKMQALLSPSQKALLAAGNETGLTAKGCLSANIIGNVLAAGVPNNISSLPPTIFDECTATDTAQAVFNVTKKKASPCKGEEEGSWVAFDIIGTFGLLTGYFSIDSHPMWVYAVDGSYIEPMRVDAMEITNGDRFSVLVRAGADGDYTMRMASDTAAQMMTGYATLSVRTKGVAYTASNNTSTTAYINDVGSTTSDSVVLFDQAAMKAFPADVVSATADRTFRLGIQVAGASYNWALNNTVFPEALDNEAPLLFHPQAQLQNNLTITTHYGEWVDLVFQALTFPMPPHPIHKHGTKMWLIGSGKGTFAYDTVAEAIKEIPESFNLETPPKRDTLATPNAITGLAWMVVRYQVTNPGAWFLHCHIQSHLLGGMAMSIQDGIDRWPEVPREYLEYE